jgi:integrase
LRSWFVEVGRGHRVKTRGSVRPVELSPTAEAVLRRLDAERTTEADGYVFKMPGGGAVEVGFLTKRLKDLAKRAKIEKNIVAYSLRHTFGTRALLAGGNPAAVAGTLGTSLQMVQDHYGHYERQAGRGLVGRVFGGAPLEGSGLVSKSVES